MAKKKSKKRMIILAAALAVLALAAYGYIRISANASELTKTAYDIVDVKRGSIEVKVKGAGSVEPQNDDSVYAAVAGTVQGVYAENGDAVSAGDIIAVLKNKDLESERDSLITQINDADASIASLRGTEGSEYIRAAAGGTLRIVYAKKGDSVDAVMDKFGALAVISTDDMLKTVLPFNPAVSQGQPVTVASNGKSVRGTVTGIAAAAGKMTVEFKSGGFVPGNTADVTAGETALGEGAIEIANPVYVTGRGGKISAVFKSAGKSVSRGDKLFRLSGDILSDKLYSKIDERERLKEKLAGTEADLMSLTVRAGTDGIISDLSLSRDEMVQAGQKLFAVKSVGKVKIDVEVDELDIADITVGQRATAAFDALGGRKIAARVAKINPIGVSRNNVTHYTVTLELDEAQGLMLGMSADVEIISRRADNVLCVPIEAIQVINGEKYVALETDIDKKSEAVTATRRVTTGVSDGVNIEITSGLSEGDKVVIPRVKQSAVNMFGMGGGGAANMGGSSSAPVRS